MKPPVANWVAIVYKAGKRVDTFKLAEGATTIGRDPRTKFLCPTHPSRASTPKFSAARTA